MPRRSKIILFREAQCQLDDYDCGLVMADEKSQRNVEFIRGHEA
jgi:hypothetical protein